MSIEKQKQSLSNFSHRIEHVDTKINHFYCSNVVNRIFFFFFLQLTFSLISQNHRLMYKENKVLKQKKNSFQTKGIKKI
jgi:hypothetical protein